MTNIVIAGTGFAAGVMALRALQLGFEVSFLEVPRPDIGGVEIIPSSARHLLAELGLGEVLAAVGPGYGVGMLRCFDERAPDFRKGRALHIDRLALRRAVIAEAMLRGAKLQRLAALPEPDPKTFASIDATGRRAVWSRPVNRWGRNVADLFSAPRSLDGGAALLVGLGNSWGYAAADRSGTTIGIIHDGRRSRPELERAIRLKFGIAQGAPVIPLGRRPAFPQWAASPLRGRVIAIGDAAFSHDPIGGRGLAFALGSAFAAAAVLQTWRDHPTRAELAAAYYADYVAAERRRHLAYLSRDQPIYSHPFPEHVIWAAKVASVPLALEDGIGAREVALTRDGTPVRWMGRFDILELRALCDRVQPTNDLLEMLCRKGLTAAQGRATIDWALRNGLLCTADLRVSASKQNKFG